LDDGRIVYLVFLVSLLLWLLPTVVPLSPSGRMWLARAAVAVLGLGFVIVLWQIGVWLLRG
jgi:hypothetical protein